MSQPTNTFDSYDAKGNREDLQDKIYMVSPEKTPVVSAIGRYTAKNTLHEWQRDSLASPNKDNAVIEGDDRTGTSLTATERVGNYTQLFDAVAVVTSTQEKINKAGRSSEMRYQISKKMTELKRDLEAAITSNNAAVAGNSSTARKMGALLSWITTNSSVGTSGADPTTIGVSTRTDGTARSFTETILKDVIQQVYSSGGNPKVLMVGAYQKQAVSAFAGIAAQRYMAPGNEPTTIIGAADVYMSDFGTVSVVPNRFMRTRDALVLDPEYAALAYLRPFATNELAKTGDSEKTQILAELTLEVRNEAAHGIAADLAVA